MNRISAFFKQIDPHIIILTLLLIILLMLIPASLVFGSGTVGSGTPGSCTEAALDSALAGGGNVTFNCGGSHTLVVTSQKTITINTVINGGGNITLSGGGSTRIFNVQNGATLTLQNLALTNGYSAGNGGAIYLERLGTLDISGSTLSNSQAANGGAIAMNGWGANDLGGTLILNSSVFSNNTATAAAIPGGGNGGGALYVTGGSTATVVGTMFTGNQSVNGGAIHVLLANLTVTNGTFTNNVANNAAGGGGGGAIYIDGTKAMSGDIHVELSHFSGNHTNQLGGAIFSFPEGTGTTTIVDSTFDGNYAVSQGQGGALYHQSATTNGPLIVNSSTFVNNYAHGENGNASQGGALWLLDAPVTVTNSTFYANDATTQESLAADDWRRGFGGAIRSSDGMVIVNSTIANNTAGFVGGGIAGDSVTLRNTIVSNNSGGNPWDIQQNCTNVLTNGGNNIQYPQKTTGNFNDYECLEGQTAVNPQLGTLGDYGGPTETVPLNAGSPAINAGNNCPATDQRGFSRSGACDMGAYEFGGGIVANSMSPSMAGLNDIQSLTLTVQGAGFSANSVVRWNGADRATTYVNPFVVTAVIPTTDVDTLGTFNVTVYNPDLTMETPALTFTVVQNLSRIYLPFISNP
ncbi:MAG: hypothetical protein GY943_21520 [Chloroflexi bacterium]|nr:hypothetical protein [Chloroflexota bacterium]